MLGNSKVCKYVVVVEFHVHFCVHHSYLELRTDLRADKVLLFSFADEE